MQSVNFQMPLTITLKKQFFRSGPSVNAKTDRSPCRKTVFAFIQHTIPRKKLNLYAIP